MTELGAVGSLADVISMTESTVKPFHTDGRHGLLTVLLGVKVIKVLPFKNGDKFPQLPMSKAVGKAHVDAYCPFDTGSKLWSTYTLLPGDSIFIQQRTWHAVHSPMRRTVGMAIDIERK